MYVCEIVLHALVASRHALCDVVNATLECHPAKGECGPLRKQLKAKAVPFLEESQQVSKNTYQPTKQWGPTVAAFREDLQSPQCAFLNVTLS